MNDETMNCREAFEKVAGPQGYSLVRRGETYRSSNTDLAWEWFGRAWQIGNLNTRAQASAPEGEPVAWRITFWAKVEIDNNRYEPISKTFVTYSKEIAYAHISSDDSVVVPLFTRSNAKAAEVERDAARYRWLRNEAHKEPFYSKLGPYTDWGGELGSIGGLDLDMAVDEALSTHDKTKA